MRGELIIEPTSDHALVLVRLVVLFYRYMLPHFTTEAYSWADPVERDSGFKTGVKNGLFSSFDESILGIISELIL